MGEVASSVGATGDSWDENKTYRWTKRADDSRKPSITEALQENVRIGGQEGRRALVGRMPSVFMRVSKPTTR